MRALDYRGHFYFIEKNNNENNKIGWVLTKAPVAFLT